jgi:putative effector of murein hydrolase
MILHPLIVSMFPVVIALKLAHVDYTEYLHQTYLIQFLLGPATVALAWPMYRQLHVLGKIWGRLLATIVIGGLLAPAICVATAAWLGAPETMLSSLVAKSITTPIALSVVAMTGGNAALTAGAVAVTGIVGAICAPTLLHWLKITDERVKGFTIGITSHAFGTARAFEISDQTGAFSSLALSMNGVFTALVMPVLWSFIQVHYL